MLDVLAALAKSSSIDALSVQLLVVGAGAVASGLLGIKRWQRARDKWPTVEATVQRFGLDSDRVRVATLVYEPTAGDRRVAVVRSSSSWGLGSTVTLAFNPSDPGQFQVVCGRPAWSYVLLAVGTVLIATAFAIEP